MSRATGRISSVLRRLIWRTPAALLAISAVATVVWAASQDGTLDIANGKPSHSPNEMVNGLVQERNPADVSDDDQPWFYVAVWKNDITGAEMNYNCGNGWQVAGMSWDAESTDKTWYRTNVAVTSITDKPPGTQVEYDFKVWDGGDMAWVKQEGTYRTYGTGSNFTFTVEGTTAQPTTVTADSSATATVSCWVTETGTPKPGITVTFTITSANGAFVSTGNKTATATTDANGKAEVQVRSGFSGTVTMTAANATYLELDNDTTASVAFNTFLTDGNPSDFPGDTAGMSDSSIRISQGAWLYKDPVSDYQAAANIDPDPTNFSSYDIKYVKIAASSDSFRAAVVFDNFVNLTDYPHVLIGIDTDVTRDTSTAMTTPGPGTASSTRDYGQWWLPANAYTGTRHQGTATAAGRGEREQQDFSAGGMSDGLLPNRWVIDGGGIDSVYVQAASTNDQRSCTTNERVAGSGGPRDLWWDYNQNSNELYTGATPWNGTDADYFLWVADETTTSTTNIPWSKAGLIMDAFDWRFTREKPGFWITVTDNRGSLDADSAAQGTSPCTATTDIDGDNRHFSVGASSDAAPFPIEGRVDLDELYSGTGGVRNGDVFLVVSSYQTNNNDDGGGPNGEQWDQVPAQGASNTIGWDEWQRITIEDTSSTSDDQVCEWERAISFVNYAPGAGNGTGYWVAPGGRAVGARRVEFGRSFADAATHDCFEYDIRWMYLLGQTAPLPRTLRFTIAVGEGLGAEKAGGDEFNDFKYLKSRRASGTGRYGDVSSFIDCVSDATTSTEVGDSDVDYFVDIDFNKDGRVNSPPDTPTGLGIAESGDGTTKGSGVVLNDPTPIFRWTFQDTDGGLASCAFSAWQIQVDNDPAFGSVLYSHYSGETASAVQEFETTNAVPTGDTYYWRIRTRDDFGWSPWTNQTFSFRINSAPNAPSALKVDGRTNPTDVDNDIPRFSWTFSDPDPTDGSSGFRWEVWDAARTTRIYGETSTTSSQTMLDYPETAIPLEGGIRYYWRVQYQDLNDSWSAWTDSTTTYFEIPFASPGARDVKIAEVGNGYGAVAAQDYAMLWNPTETTVALKGTSFQRWSTDTRTNWSRISFGSNDTIAAGGYYLLANFALGGRDTQVPDTLSSGYAFSVITTTQGFAFVRNTQWCTGTDDSDIIDGVGLGQAVDGANVTAGWLGASGRAIVRKATQSANTHNSLHADSDLLRAGHYKDENVAGDWIGLSATDTQYPRGRSFGASRIDFTLDFSPDTTEAGCTCNLRVRAFDVTGSVGVSDTSTSSMVGPVRLSVSAGAVSADTMNFSLGNIDESVSISGVTYQTVTVTGDTTFGLDTTGAGAISGTTTIYVYPATAPTKPVVFQPAADATVSAETLTIKWVASSDTTAPIVYTVQIADISDFSSIYRETQTVETQATFAFVKSDSYWVRVGARDGCRLMDTSVAVAFSTVQNWWVNEFLVDPQIVDWNQDGDGANDEPHDEWIELYNASGTDLSLNGWRLGDNADPYDIVFGNKDTVPAYGYFVVHGDSFVGMTLNNSADTIWFINSAGETVDCVYYGAYVTERSRGRATDGSLNWTTFRDTPVRFAETAPAWVYRGETFAMTCSALFRRWWGSDSKLTATSSAYNGTAAISVTAGTLSTDSKIGFTAGDTSFQLSIAGVSDDTVTITLQTDSLCLSPWYPNASTNAGTRTIYSWDHSGPNAWYVNDASHGGADSFTNAPGDTANHGLTPDYPLLRIDSAATRLSAGDTIFIDAGQYQEYDSILIDTYPVWVIGVDSASTIIDFGDSTSALQKAFSAPLSAGVERLVVEDLAVRHAWRAYFLFVDTSVVRRVSATYCGGGIFLEGGSDSNEVTGCYAARNDWTGFLISAAHRNLFTGNTSYWNKNMGFLVGWGSDSNVFTSNRSDSNENEGFKIDDSDTNTFTSNFADTNVYAAYSVVGGGTYNDFTSNQTRQNKGQGFWLAGAGTASNTFTANTVDTPGYQGGTSGFYVNANDNVFRQNRVRWPTGYGFDVNDGDSNVFDTNHVITPTGYGFFVHNGADTNTLRWCGNDTSSGDGWKFEDGDYNTAFGCTTVGDAGSGFALTGTANNNTLRSCTTTRPTGAGLWIDGGGSNVVESGAVLSPVWRGISLGEPATVIRGMTMTGGGNLGIYVVQADGGRNDTIADNVITGFADDAIQVDSAAGIVIRGNTLRGNVGDGIDFRNFSVGCSVTGNLISNNVVAGVRIDETDSSFVTANEFDSNLDFEIVVGANCQGIEIHKNDIRTSSIPGHENHGAWLNLPALDLRRNWWRTTDSTSVYAMFNLAAGATEPPAHIPYRLGLVDTRPFQDSVAPRAPDTVAAAGADATKIKISWAAVTLDEEADDLATGLAGYRIYRSTTADTSFWIHVGSAGATTTYVDDSGGLGAGQTYYYRVTSLDGAETVNESWYSAEVSASVVSDTTPPDTPMGLVAVADVVGPNVGVALTWDTNAGARFRLYRASSNDSYAANEIGGGLLDTASFCDTTPAQGDTCFYFLVAVDSTGNRSGTTYPGVTAPALVASKRLVEVRLAGGPVTPRPGATFTYEIAVEDTGFGPADSVVIFDTVVAGIVFRDTDNAVQDGWQFQYCTTANPDQSYLSDDFDAAGTPVGSQVVYIRWRNPMMSTKATVAARFRVIVQ